MILEFLPEASVELYAAAEYYEEKQEGLGWRFRSEVLQVCQLIVQQPLLWRERTGGYRREVKGVGPGISEFVVDPPGLVSGRWALSGPAAGLAARQRASYFMGD